MMLVNATVQKRVKHFDRLSSSYIYVSMLLAFVIRSVPQRKRELHGVRILMEARGHVLEIRIVAFRSAHRFFIRIGPSF